MSDTSYKAHFQRALTADAERIHIAAHSHHLWPDVTFDAHMAAWNDAARLADRKWDKVFGEVLPSVQAHVARILGLPDPSTIAFAPNTHELYKRVLSCLDRPGGRKLRVLTTDAEFHSFSRQTARLEESGGLAVTRIAAQPFASFAERFSEACGRETWDLVYVSHVLFSSGYALPDLAAVVAAVRSPETFVVIDGYHAFMAIPVNLTKLHDRIFYLAGGYKYAMSGEGACFMHVPSGYGPRPRDTGWYAAFGALAHAQSNDVPYAPGGARFMGATFDPSALYRMNAVLALLDRIGADPGVIHTRAVALQEALVQGLEAGGPLHAGQLVVPLSETSRGQFLTFETPRAAELHAALLTANVVTDVRGDRLRLGFGLYLDRADVARALERLRSICV